MDYCGVEASLGKYFDSRAFTFDGVQLPGRLYQKDSTATDDASRLEPWRIEVPKASGKNKHWTIPEFYCAHISERPIAHWAKSEAKGEQMVWALRALFESGALGNLLPPVRSVRLPPGVRKSCTTVYQGFLYLVRLRLLYKKDQTEHPFSYRFIGDWCSIGSYTTTSKALKWLTENGYIKISRRVQGPGPRPTYYYSIAAPSVESLARNKDARGLIEVLRDANTGTGEESSDAAEQELLDLGQPAIAPLVEALADDDDNVIERASGLLIRMSNLALESLVEALSSTNTKQQINAIRTLGNISSNDAIEALLRALECDNVEVQGSVIEALAWRGGERALGPLKQLQKQTTDDNLANKAGQVIQETIRRRSEGWPS
jgi:HEAT repeats